MSALATQQNLRLRVSNRVKFLTLEAVRATTGDDAETTLARVLGGRRPSDALQWVFDVGLGKDKRELRFWAPEIEDAEATRHLELAEVLNRILGPCGQHLAVSRGEIERQWIVSHVTVGRWIAAGEVSLLLPGKISRASLAQFLTKRWCCPDGAAETLS